MTRAENIDAIEKATGKSWEEWLKILEVMDAQNLSHTDIARQLYDRLAGTIDSHGWWAQAITVAYEQQIGRRVPGQRSDGSFEVSVSKTIAGDWDAVFAAWRAGAQKLDQFRGVAIEKASHSTTPKWRNWRANLADGSKVVVGITQKGENKTLFGLAHQKLPDQATMETWRTYWKEFLKNFDFELPS